ncbi:MAG: M48 family metallopeptidase [Elusimicrobia bacterium]|nr:M48 family metallopeptidase [Elusimicrobiota bacterium]
MVLNNYSYKVSYRDIKYPRVELKTGRVLFVLPFGYNSDNLFEKHKGWIYKKIDFIEDCLDGAKSKGLVERSDEEFKGLIRKAIKGASLNLKVKINKVYFRKMKTKWASLSSLKNLTVNRFMKYLPEYLIGYIIFHELAHVIEKKHNGQFWQIISKRHSDYQKFEKELFEYWFKVSEKVGMQRN